MTVNARVACLLLCVALVYQQQETDQAMGVIPQEGGRTVFPEFPWILENSILMRDGQALNPRENFIDLKTKSVHLYFTFYSLSQKVRNACKPGDGNQRFMLARHTHWMMSPRA